MSGVWSLLVRQTREPTGKRQCERWTAGMLTGLLRSLGSSTRDKRCPERWKRSKSSPGEFNVCVCLLFCSLREPKSVHFGISGPRTVGRRWGQQTGLVLDCLGFCHVISWVPGLTNSMRLLNPCQLPSKR